MSGKRVTAYRHRCMYGGVLGRHDQGEGKPRRKRCSHCGGSFVVTYGRHGVFLHSSFGGNAAYREADAVAIYATLRAAEKRRAELGDEYVTRFITDGMAQPSA